MGWGRASPRTQRKQATGKQVEDRKAQAKGLTGRLVGVCRLNPVRVYPAPHPAQERLTVYRRLRIKSLG